MKRSLVFSLALTLVACNKKNDAALPEGTPRCIEKKIRGLQKEGVRNPPASIVRYPYNNGLVYYIPASCCDQYSELYDEDCNLLCAPDGGFSGSGDGRCPADLKLNAADAVEIWRDPR